MESTNYVTDMAISSGMYSTTKTFSSSTDECAVEQDFVAYATFYLIAIGVLVVCSVFLLIATACNWRVLRQNIVYRYLVSCLLSSIAFCLLGAYNIYHSLARVDDGIVEGGILQRYDLNDTTHQHVMTAWAFRRVLLPCLLIVIEFNIAVLIYSVKDNTPLVGRYSVPENISRPPLSNAQTTSKAQFCRACLTGRNFKATFQILGAWLTPLILSIPAGLKWNCVQHCKCLPVLKPTATCRGPESGDICSRVWTPATRSFAIVITAMYLGTMVYIFTMLVLMIRKFYKMHAPKKINIKFTDSRRKKISEVIAYRRRNSRGGLKKKGSNPSRSQSYHGNTMRPTRPRLARYPSAMELGNDIHVFSTDAVISSKEVNSERNENSYSPARLSINRHKRPPLHSTIKLLIALTVSIFVSTTPMIFIFCYDVIAYPAPFDTGDAMNIAMGITYLYSASLPLILLGYMSGIRTACVNTLIKCPCLRTTEVSQTRPNRKTENKIWTFSKEKKAPRSEDSVKETSVSMYSTTSISPGNDCPDKTEHSIDEGKEAGEHEEEDRCKEGNNEEDLVEMNYQVAEKEKSLRQT